VGSIGGYKIDVLVLTLGLLRPAQIGQSRPDSGLGWSTFSGNFQNNFQVVPSSLDTGLCRPLVSSSRVQIAADGGKDRLERFQGLELNSQGQNCLIGAEFARKRARAWGQHVSNVGGHGTNLNRFKDLNLKAKARISP